MSIHDPLEPLDEGLSARAPLAGRAVRWLVNMLYRLSPEQRRGPYMVLGIMMLAGVGAPAVAAVNHWWFTLALIALSPWPGLALHKESAAWIYRVAFGKPVFGVYGGVPRRVLGAEIECAKDLWIRLQDELADENLKESALTVESFVEAHTKDAYLRIHEERSGEPPSQQQWEEYWRRATTKAIARSTYSRALAEHPFAFALVPGWLLRTKLVVPLADVMVAVFALVSLAAIDTWTPLPALLMISTLFGLVATVLAVAIGSARPEDTISLDFPAEFDASVDRLIRISELERSALKSRASTLAGVTVQIIDIRTGPRFKRTIARFLRRQLSAVLAVDLAALLVWMAFLLGVATPLADDRAALAAWYGRQAALLIMLSAGALMAYHFWGFLLHRIGDIVGPPVGAAIAAAIVPVGKYLVTGHFEFDVTTVAAASVAGAVGLYGARLGETAKRQDRRPG